MLVDESFFIAFTNPLHTLYQEILMLLDESFFIAITNPLHILYQDILKRSWCLAFKTKIWDRLQMILYFFDIPIQVWLN